MGPKLLYLHGFASGPGSAKAVYLAEHFVRRGVLLERLDLRVPSMEHLRLSAILHTVRDAIGDERGRAVLIGSSLGGLVAARVAEEDARVCALVLLAPAFRLVQTLRRAMGYQAWGDWERSGWMTTKDHARGGDTRVDFDFVRDAEPIDARGGGWPDVRVPALIVHGRADETVDVNLSRTWAAGKRHVHLVETDDGHDQTASLDLIAAEADRFLAPWLG